MAAHLQCQPFNTPIEVNHNLQVNETVPTNKFKLIYLPHKRPDLPYTVKVLSQCMHDPIT